MTRKQGRLARDPGSRSAGDELRYGMIAQSAAMRRVLDNVERMANRRAPVVIQGDSGSGKELIARALHEASARRDRPFLALNCGGLSSALIESELFGHVRGAFTGAVTDKSGAFEATNGGTLFLDEIGELPLELQPKFLRVLESAAVRRVGGTREIGVDTRIVAATHRNLEDLVRAGRFREDLFHRLFVLTIRVPPLRARREDVLLLARHFLRGDESGRPRMLSRDAEEALLRHSWPGNVRELRNVISRALSMTDTEVIRARDIEISGNTSAILGDGCEGDVRTRILRALAESKGNRAQAAAILGVSRATLYRLLSRLEVPRKAGTLRGDESRARRGHLEGNSSSCGRRIEGGSASGMPRGNRGARSVSSVSSA